jgi:MSHA pilin protein MshD
MSTSDFPPASIRRAAGVSLVELVVFIVIVSIAVTAVLATLNVGGRSTVDPMIRKQALAIAEGLIEEVEAMPYTWCDPRLDPVNVLTATSYAGCATPETPPGPEAGEARYSPPAVAPFNNVNDYAGFDTSTANPAGIADIGGNVIPALSGYRAQVAVAQQTISGVNNILRITVTVTHAASNATVVLDGYRAMYAPNTVQ